MGWIEVTSGKHDRRYGYQNEACRRGLNRGLERSSEMIEDLLQESGKNKLE